MSATKAIDMREKAIRYAVGILRHATDWQEGQTALGDHDEFRPWLEAEDGDDGIMAAQSIIREAEERLGNDLPY